ncbi:TPA: RNA-binding virulence regulatory protein CvfB, partial [Staphylococcus aureus]|nr:RNA-binding virulence regulatory protein CvfB [Staphylococcus aureus]
MALDKDIVGSIEFLEVVGLQGSTYLLKGPNGENVKLNQSEMNDDDELEVGEEYSFFIYPNRSGELFATQNMPDITKDKYDFAKVLKTDRDGARIDVGLPREVLVPWEDLPKVKSLWPQPGDHLLVTLRIDRENHMYGRLASESVVENMFTPVHDDNLKNEVIEAKPYRVLRIGSFLLSESGYKIFVHESERKAEP